MPRIVRTMLILIALSTLANEASAQYRTMHYVFGNGGGLLSGGQYRTAVTVGQPAVGATAGESYSTNTGFWPAAQGIPSVGVATEDAPTEQPRQYQLDQNYPNPFNPTTQIRYELPKESDVLLIVYDLLGREVAVLVDTRQQAGRHEAQWNGRDRAGRSVGSGMYMYRLQTSDYARARTMTLIK